MSTTFPTPNMGMILPVVGQDLGPQWATDLFTALSTINDAHNHTPGKGVLVPTAGLNINADLGFGSFNATALRSTRYTSQGSPLGLGTDVGCTYVSNGELWYNDTSNRQVQLTKTGNANFSFLSYVERTPAISGNFTILATDAFSLYYVDTSGGVATVNLPASSGVAVGRTYTFVDIKRNAATNNISIVPNGTDKINGVNATLVVATNGSYTTLTTDAAGNWYATSSSSIAFDPLNISSNLQWISAQVNPTILQASTAAATGQNLLFQSQASTNANGTPGNLVFNTPNKTGSGNIGYSVFEGNASEVARIGGWNNADGGAGVFYLGPITGPLTTNYAVYCDGSTATQFNCPSGGAWSILVGNGGNCPLMGNANGLEIGAFGFSLGGGSGVIGIANRTTAPTANGTGIIKYAEGGAEQTRGSGGAITMVAPAGAGTQNTQAGTTVRTRTFSRTTTSGATFTVDTPIPNTSTCFLRMQVTARVVTGGTGTAGDSWAWMMFELVKTTGGVTTNVGTLVGPVTAGDTNMNTGSAVAISVSGNNIRLTMTASTGEGATPTIDWQVEIENFID